MNNRFYCAGNSPALHYAAKQLSHQGYRVFDRIQWDTTDVLLDVPSTQDGILISTLLASLPGHVHIWGGNLRHPGFAGFSTTDLLQDEIYLLENATITADCAMELAGDLLTGPAAASPALVIGWGRIGKKLVGLLADRNFPVTVAARKDADLKQAEDLGFHAVAMEEVTDLLPELRLIFNTAPAAVLTETQAGSCRDCVKIDLASVRGIPGADVTWARGLPGKMAPERSGRLIADTILRLIGEDTI